jgi:multimeric flavodoxin WrbA
MKVVLISGSPRANGNTAILIGECAKIIQQAGIETEVFSLVDMPIRSCVSCHKCRTLGECGIEDGLNHIIKVIRGAEGLIVGTPVYFGTARGDVLSALQRIGYVSRNTDKFLAGKIGGCIAVARRNGQDFTVREMMMFFLANDMVVPGSIHPNVAFGRKPGEVAADEEGMDTARHFAANVARLVKKLHGEAEARSAPAAQ